MPQVKLKKGDQLMLLFVVSKCSCEKAGVLVDVRKREFYEKPTQERESERKLQQIKRYQKKLTRESVRIIRS